MSGTHLLQTAATRSLPPGGSRVGQVEVQRRLTLVERLLAEGVPRTAIAAELGLARRTVDGYISRVRRAWQVGAREGHESARARALNRLMELRLRLLDARAWGPLIRLEQLLCELEGVRGGPAETAPDMATAPRLIPRALPAEALRERAPLLVEACGRAAAASQDNELKELTRCALSRALLRPAPE